MQKKDILTDIMRTIIMLSVLCVCPLMEGYAGGPHEESCELMMRGWELMHFSTVGAVPLILVPLFLFGGGVLGQVRVRATIVAVGLACYAYSFGEMQTWLAEVSDTAVTYEYGAAVYPLVLIAAAAWRACGTLMKRSA